MGFVKHPIIYSDSLDNYFENHLDSALLKIISYLLQRTFVREKIRVDHTF